MPFRKLIEHGKPVPQGSVPPIRLYTEAQVKQSFREFAGDHPSRASIAIVLAGSVFAMAALGLTAYAALLHEPAKLPSATALVLD
jgi:hypothetical protein